MSDTLVRVQALAKEGVVLISGHGYDEFAADGMSATDVLVGLPSAIEIEDYPNARKGPSVLAFRRTRPVAPIHVVWGAIQSGVEKDRNPPIKADGPQRTRHRAS